MAFTYLKVKSAKPLFSSGGLGLGVVSSGLGLGLNLVTMVKVKVKGSSLDIAPLTILDSGALQPRKWQLTGIDCSTAAQAVAAQSPR